MIDPSDQKPNPTGDEAMACDHRPPVEISFLVAAHNVAPFIESAIVSALRQRDCALEIIVVDDGSADGTADIVSALSAKDDRIVLLRNGKSEGAAAARNRALAVARGTWVAVLDGDDEIRPERSRVLVDAAVLHAADIMADNIVRFGSRIQGAPTALPIGPEPYSVLLKTAEYLRRNRVLHGGTNLGYLKPIFRRSFLIEHGLRYEDRLRVGEDFQFCLTALVAGARFYVISEALYRYRVRPGSLSWRLAVADVDALQAAYARLEPAIRRARDPDLDNAAGAYVRALGRARSILGVIEHAQAGRLFAALRLSVVRPKAWQFLVPTAVRVLTRSAWRQVAGVPE